MNNLICEHPFLIGISIASILATILIIIVFEPWYKFVCYSKEDIEDQIKYNKINNRYYYFEYYNGACLNKVKMTSSDLKSYNLDDIKTLKNEIKMENPKSSLLLKILKRCFLIILIILTYKIGVVIIETVPNLVKNQLTIINK